MTILLRYRNGKYSISADIEKISVNKDFYMNDFLKSGECVKDLVNIATQLIQLLFNKGFRLTKWISNSQIILDWLPTADLEIKNKIKDLTYENTF